MDDDPSPPEDESQAPTGGQSQGQGQSQGTGRGGTMGMNMNMPMGRDARAMGALRSIPVILRICCVVLGFVALVLPCIAWGNAELFVESRTRVLVCPYNENGDFEPSKENCTLHNFTRAENCVNRNNRYKSARLTEKTCPTKWLVIPPVYMVALGWLLVCVLFVLLCLGLLKNNAFILLDMIGHIIAAVLLIVGGLVLVGYFIQIEITATCSDKNGADEYDRNNQESRELDFWRRFGPGAPPDPPTSPAPHSNATRSDAGKDTSMPEGGSMGRAQKTQATLEFIKNDCPNLEFRLYHKWHVFGGGFVAVITGVLVILIIIFSRKGAVRPMM